MSRMNRLYQGVRWKKIVAKLNQNDDVTRTNSDSSFSLEETEHFTQENGNSSDKKKLSSSTSINQLEVPVSDEKGAFNYNLSMDDEDCLKQAINPRKTDFKKSVSLSDLTKDNLLGSRSRQRSVPPSFRVVSSLTRINSDMDAITLTRKFAKVRSLSLSDLTHDTRNDYSCTRKSQSVPLLTENLILTRMDSPSILQFYAGLPDEDDNFLNVNSSDSELNTAPGADINEGRKRRLVADPDAWKKNTSKRLRLRGEQYLGYKKPKGETMTHDTVRQARQLGDTCNSSFCRKSKLRGCDSFTDDTRKQIHSNFWKNMSWDQRKVYVNGLVKRSNTAQKTKKSEGESRRQGTLSYFLPITRNGNEKVQVCRDMFLKTLSLGSFTVQSWVKKSEYGTTPDAETRKESRPTRTLDERKIKTVHSFLDNIPKLPSHYARKDTTKLFIEPMFFYLKGLFDAYKKHCTINNEPNVCRYTFEKKFYEKNLSLYTLKKDMCDLCSSYKAGNFNEADYQIHLIKKDRARHEKDEDKIRAANGEFILLTMDLESVKVCPYLTASSLYFKTKLTCHNFTMYNLISNHCTCYWFDETAADLTSSTFASFVIDYLEKHCLQQKLPILIYSDGCTYQNRNAILSNALLNFSKKHQITVTQKFLEPGHTQMECDSVHAAIERKLKNREIHLPSDYISITKEARNREPYETVQVDYDFVKNYADPDTWVYKSIRPGRKAGDPQVVDIRAIAYEPNLRIKVKLNFDGEWMDLPQRQKLLGEVNYLQLHFNRIPIKASKFNHLQQLKSVLPKDCHNFYDLLPYA